MAAQIQILGPVQLKIDNQLVDLRGSRQQRLLGMLAIHGCALVTTDRLIDAVWPDEQLPPNPRATLRTYVSRLRGSFDNSSSIESRDGGYALAIDSLEIDATTFETYLSETDRTSVPSRRADLLGAALALWSGPALDGFSSEPWARAVAARLDELRAGAVEERARALIDAGNADLAISELEAAVRMYPHRETPVELLMSALDQRGRRPDALRAYNDYWSRLATDLGIEPGADIVALEQRIVAGEPAQRTLVPLRGYELGERIGEGAFAIVYRATQPAVGRTVAIKQIRRELANRPEFIRRFEAEAHLVARLEHPRIVPLYDYWREPDSAFLVMRWLRGGSLAQSLLDGPWAVERTVNMILEIAEGLHAAHQAGVIHRDIKPENVLLDEEGSAYLTDFGIALEESADPDPDAALSIGSPAYASPEQLRRERVGPASDIWGLGITLFETLTGRLPFAEATTQAELLDAQLHQRVPSVRSFRADVPRLLDDVISRATAKSPTDRYPSATAFITALEQLASKADLLPAQSRPRVLSTALPIHTNPYKGLRAFDEADARDFHGRARLIDEIGAQLLLDGPAGRFVLLVGPSGSGKSSAVRAGLIPAMRKGLVGSSADWFYTTMTPGTHPFEELEAALLRVAVNPPSSLLEQLRADDRGLLRASKRVLPDEHADVVIVIDQFEELFTLCEDASRRARFLDALTTAVTDPASPVRIVATLRADFYDRPLEHQSFGSLTRDQTIAVAPLAPDQLEHAIVDPAASAGCEFEPGLVAAIVAEVGDQPGALPLLQFALTSLFDRQVSGLLTLDAYRQMGGLTGAIADRAEQLYCGGDDAHQQACHHMFARLVTLGRGAPDTRRRVPRGELGGGEALDRAIATFGAARLLSFDRDGATREPTVELAHEALIRDWPRLRSWLDSDREGLQIHRHLTAASEAWATRGRDLGDLYRGGRLETAATWGESHREQLNELEAEFLSSSSELQASEQEQERQRVVRLRALLATVAVIAVMAVIAGTIALVQRGEAARARDRAELAAVEAESERDRADQSATEAAGERDRADEVAQESDIRRLVAEATDQLDGDREVALLMALEAFRRQPSNLTLGGLQRVLVGLPAGWKGRLQGRMGYADVARSQNGSTVVAAGELGLDIFDFDTRQLVATFDAPNLTTVGISADGSTIAAGSASGDWWLLAGPDLTVVEQGNGEIITAIEFSPTQSTVAFGYANGDVAVVDDQPIILGQLEGGVRGIAWRADSRQVIAGGGITFAARVFDPQEGGQIGVDMMAIGGVTDGSTAVDFIGNDALVANGPAVRFDVASGDEISRIDAVDVRVNGRVHALDEDSFIAVESGGGTWLADFGSDSARPLTSIDSAGTAMAFENDRTLITVHAGGLDVIDLFGGRVLGAAVPRAPGRKTASISDDGRIVVSGYNGAIIWTSPGPPPVELGRVDASAAQFHGNELWLGTLAEDGSGSYTMWTESNGFEEERPYPEIASTIGLSPDGSTIVFPTGNRDTALHVVDRETGNEVIRLDALESAIPETEDFVLTLVSDIEFSPDGEHMLASTFGGVWGVWDTSTWALIRPIENGTDEISDAAFSPDGLWVASLSIRGLLSLRDAADYSVIAGPVAAHSLAEIGGRAISFTKDGRFVVTDGDNGARLWDAATLESIGSIFPNEMEQHSAELARDANVLATIIGDDIVLWNIDVDSWFEVGCRAVARNMTEAEWVQFGPVDQDYVATCESVLPA